VFASSFWFRKTFGVVPARKLSRPVRRAPLAVVRLEDRLTPDSGGAAGQLAAGVLSYGGGPLISNVVAYPIYLQDTATPSAVPAAEQSQLTTYFKTITTDSYIPSLLGQYSANGTTIGAGSVGMVDTNVPFTSTPYTTGGHTYPSISDTQITALINQEIASGRTGAAGPNSLYFVFAPPGDVVTTTDIGDSITGFVGYHSGSQDNNNTSYSYSVDPYPSAPNGFDAGVTEFQNQTSTASHELAEAITDANGSTGWFNTPLKSEVTDLAGNDTYTQDDYTVQYEYSNALKMPAHSVGTTGANLFINQVAPPAVAGFTNGGPVATFSDPDLTLNQGSFTATVDFNDGNGPLPATISGANGFYVVSAIPVAPLAAGQNGKFNNDGSGATGLTVHVTQNGGAGESQRTAPYVVSAAAVPLTYNADPGQPHTFVLKENAQTGNFELSDHGQLVFTQPIAQTTSINIGADPGADASLTVDYSGGEFANALTFDGGTGTGSHALTLQGGAFTSISDVLTGAAAGSVSLTGGAGTQMIAFKDVAAGVALTPGSATNLALTLPTGTVSASLGDNGTPSDGISQLSSGNQTFPLTTFASPTSVLTVNYGAGAAVTVNSLDAKDSAPLILTDSGAGNDTVTLGTQGAVSLAGDLAVTAGTIVVNGNVTAAAQTYTGPISFGQASTGLTGSTVTFAGPVTLGTNVVNVVGNLAVTNTAAVNVTLAGNQAGQAGELTHTGMADLGSAPLTVALQAPFAPAAGASFTVVGQVNTGGLSGIFAGLPQGAQFPVGGTTFKVTYSGGASGQDADIQTAGSNGTVATSVALTTDRLNGAVYGQAVTAIATVSAQTGTAPPTGSVQFSVDGTNVGAPVPLSAGTASLPLPLAALNAGAHQITASYTSTGPIFQSSATTTPLTETVTPAPLTLAVTNKSKVYGAALPIFTVTGTGFAAGQNLTNLTTQPITGTTATMASSVGIYPITIGGAANANYTITFKSGILTVTPALLTLTANNISKEYGAPLPDFTAISTGFVNGDTVASLTTALTFTTSATASSNVGQYAIAPAGATDPNYTITFAPGTLNVTPAPLTITADNKTKVSGSAVPALIVEFSGFVNGDTAANLASQPMATTDATQNSRPGRYLISVSRAASQNYTIAFVSGTLTIAPAAAPLVLAAPRFLKTHGVTAKLRGITVKNAAAHTLLSVHLSTSDGKFHLHAKGLKIIGNNTKTLIVSGAPAAVERALNAISLTFDESPPNAKVNLVAAAGSVRSKSATIAIE
jgi:hypothetical protein